MKKRMPAAVIAAVLIISATGCTSGGISGIQEVPPPDSLITESVLHMDEHTDDAGPEEDSSVSEVPPDTESVAQIRGSIGFPDRDDDSDEEKIFNIFCSDETFPELVLRYCDDYVQIPRDPSETDRAGSAAATDESAEDKETTDGAEEDGTMSDPNAAAGENDTAEADAESGSEADDWPEDEEIQADEDISVIRGKIGDAKVRFIICRKEGEDYLESLDLSLLADQDADAVTDLYIVNAADVQKYVDRDAHAAMALVRDLGISAHELSQQYAYTKKIGSGGDRVQRAVSYEVTPGVFLYNRQAAVDVLGSDEPSVVAEQLSDWERFDAVAREAHRSGYAMLADINDSFDAFAAGIAGDWLTETGGVKIDSALLAWTSQAELYSREGYYANDGSREVFGTFITANELMDLVRVTDMSADDFKAQYGICPGPCGWYRGGSYIVANSESDQKALCRKILEQVVLDKDAHMQMKADGIIPNSRSVLPEKAADASLRMVAVADGDAEAADGEADAAASDSDIAAGTDETFRLHADRESAGMMESVRMFLDGQDPYPVFAEAALRIRLGNVSAFDRYLCDVYKREFASYFAGVKDRDAAMKVFYREVTSLISEED